MTCLQESVVSALVLFLLLNERRVLQSCRLILEIVCLKLVGGQLFYDCFDISR